MYDNETGRFTTADLLWSAFPAHTPYHYAYNSPLTYRDPKGLAPEKEKEREELMGIPSYEDLVKSSYFHYNISSESKYDAGATSYYAREPEGGSRTGGSNSSANNGQGGQGSDGKGGSSEGILGSIYNFFKIMITGESEWVWNGVDYGSRDALVAATSREWEGNSARKGRNMTQEVIVTGKNEYGYSGDNLFDECFIQYQIGEKGDFHVNANTLNLNWVRQGDLNRNYMTGDISVNLASPKFEKRMFSQNALALGSINLTKIGDEIFRINNDIYDFDIRWNEGYTARNILTAYAGWIHGPVFDNKPIPIIGDYSPSVLSGSGSFSIIFHGTVRIRK